MYRPSRPDSGVLAQADDCQLDASASLDASSIALGEDVGVQVDVEADCGGLVLPRHYVIAAQPWTPAQADRLGGVRDTLDAWLADLDFGDSQVGLVLGNEDPAAPTVTPRPTPLPTAEPRPRAQAVRLTQNRFLLQTGLAGFAPADPGLALSDLVVESRGQFLDAEARDPDFRGRRHILIIGRADAPLGRASTLDFELGLAEETAIDVRWFCIGGGCPDLPGVQVIDLNTPAELEAELDALHAQPAPLGVERLAITSQFSERADFVYGSARPEADRMGRLESNYIRWMPAPLEATFTADYRLRPLDSGPAVPVVGNIELAGVANDGAELSRVVSQRLSIEVGEQAARPSDCRLAAETFVQPDVLGLDRELEAGLRLAVDCSAQGGLLDVVLAIDRSASMLQGQRLEEAKDAARIFIEAVDLSVARVAILAVGSQAETLVELSSDRPALLAAVDRLEAAGENDFGAAYTRVRQILRDRREGALPAVVLLSDGDTVFPTGLRSDPWLQAAFWAHLEGIRSVVVCVTDAQTCKPEFQQLAAPSSHFRLSQGGEELERFYAELARYLGRAEVERLSVSHLQNTALPYVGVPFGQDLPAVDGQRVTWQRADPLFGRSELRYTLRGAAIGRWPLARRIEATWVDRAGGFGQASLPLPMIEVEPPPISGPCGLASGATEVEPGRLDLGQTLTQTLSASVVCSDGDDPLEVVLVLDHSDSMAGPRITAMRQAVETMLDRPGGNVRFGLVAFSGQILSEQALTEDRAALLQRLLTTSPAGETNIGQALNRAGDLLDAARPGARSVVILVTDGRNSVDPQTILTAAGGLQERAELVAACIGASCDPVLAQAVTRPSYYFDLPADADVVGLFERMAEAVAGALPAEIGLVDQSSPALPPRPGSAVPPVRFGPDPNIWRFGFALSGEARASQVLTASLPGLQPAALWSRVEFRTLAGAEGSAYLPPASVEIEGEPLPLLPTSLPLPTRTPSGPEPSATPTTPTVQPPAGQLYLPRLVSGE